MNNGYDKDSILVFAPHVDDEVLGCGGTLLRHKEDYPEATRHIVYSATGHIFFRHLNDTVDQTAREKELQMSADMLGSSYDILYRGDEAYHFSTQSRPAMVGSMDNILDKIRPETVYIPAPSYHQDHIVTFEAALSALRPTKFCGFPKRILIYESAVCCAPWDGRFAPNYYVDISNFMEGKLEVLKIAHRSQSSKEGFVDAIRKRGSIHGYDAKCEFAEAFQLVYYKEQP